MVMKHQRLNLKLHFMKRILLNLSSQKNQNTYIRLSSDGDATSGEEDSRTGAHKACEQVGHLRHWR